MTSGDKIRYFFENGVFDDKGTVQYCISVVAWSSAFFK